jgi:hypothetical protein
MKAGKSWLAFDMAVSVATATPWLGYVAVDDPGAVVICSGEGDDSDLVRRLDAIARSRGLDPDALDVTVCCRVPHLNRQGHLDLLAAQLVARPKLLILDPLYLSVRGQDGTNLYGMGELLETVQLVCQTTGTALAVVTHYNRKGGRGPGRITGAGPAEWGRVLVGVEVQSRHTDPDTKATTVVAELDIVGGSIPDATFRMVRTVQADDSHDLDSDLHYHVGVTETDGQALTDELTPAQQKLLEALRKVATPLDPQPVRVLVDWIAKPENYGHGLQYETCRKALNRLADLDLVDAIGEPGKPKLWWSRE